MKNKFIKSTIILIIGGLITKVLGMIIKIVLTRTIGTEGISEYMLVLPTFNLFITLCNLGVPIAITKLISEKKMVFIAIFRQKNWGLISWKKWLGNMNCHNW